MLFALSIPNPASNHLPPPARPRSSPLEQSHAPTFLSPEPWDQTGLCLLLFRAHIQSFSRAPGSILKAEPTPCHCFHPLHPGPSRSSHLDDCHGWLTGLPVSPGPMVSSPDCGQRGLHPSALPFCARGHPRTRSGDLLPKPITAHSLLHSV